MTAQKGTAGDWSIGGARFWAIVTAAVWFLCGVGVGALLSPREPERTPDARYADELSRTFDLDGLRRSTLQKVLEDRANRRAEVLRTYESRAVAAMDADLSAIDVEVENLIRNTIIPPGKRRAFDDLGKPLPLVIGAPADETH